MKLKFLSLLAVVICGFSAHAQDTRGSVTVYSEEGEKFTLFLNGEQKNSTPSTRVVVDNVTEVPVSFRILFESTSTPELTKKGLRGGKTCLYSIQKNKKGSHSLRIKDCKDLFEGPADPNAPSSGAPEAQTSEPVVTNIAVSTPDQLSATYANGIITLNDGRAFAVSKVKVNGMTYPRLFMNAPSGAQATVKFDGNNENFAAEVPFKYEVKDYENNNNYFTLTVDEGGPAKTWHVKLQNSNGYDLKID